MSETNLMPCPFCGETPEIVQRNGYYLVNCPDDDCAGSNELGTVGQNGYVNERFAREAWNRRPAPTEDLRELTLACYAEARSITVDKARQDCITYSEDRSRIDAIAAEITTYTAALRAEVERLREIMTQQEIAINNGKHRDLMLSRTERDLSDEIEKSAHLRAQVVALGEALSRVRRLASGEEQVDDGEDAEDALRRVDRICSAALAGQGEGHNTYGTEREQPPVAPGHHWERLPGGGAALRADAPRDGEGEGVAATSIPVALGEAKPPYTETELLWYISNTPDLLDLLYDANLLPEQTAGSADYQQTLMIAAHWRRDAQPARPAGEDAESALAYMHDTAYAEGRAAALREALEVAQEVARNYNSDPRADTVRAIRRLLEKES